MVCPSDRTLEIGESATAAYGIGGPSQMSAGGTGHRRIPAG